MMLWSILAGITAALVSTLPQILHHFSPRTLWLSPIFILSIGAVAMMLQKFVLNRGYGNPVYDGLADLFVHIHLPNSGDTSVRWGGRGLISFLLACFGGVVGPEGAAVEWTQTFLMKIRGRASRWFEQRRRTDVSVSLAGGIAAAFSAPFAGVLLPIELGIGGRAIDTAFSALVAYLFTRFLMDEFYLQPFNVLQQGVMAIFPWTAWREWLGVGVIGVVGGGLGGLTIRFIQYTRGSLASLFQTQIWMRVLAASILLFFVFFIYRPGYQPSEMLIQHIFGPNYEGNDIAPLLITQFLSLALVLSGFGTIGIFWPLFALGGLLGYAVNHWLLNNGLMFASTAGLAGAVALWSAVLGAPLSGAVLAFELTQNLHLLLPYFLVGLIALEVRRLLRVPSLVEGDLALRGMRLLDGRSAAILDSLTVREAMTTDHEVVHEQEPVSDLRMKALKSRYPFLPVVNAQGSYVGLLTLDMIQDSWQSQNTATSHSSLAHLLEAKDLLYRSGFKSEPVKVTDSLLATAGLFQSIPCAPVIGEEGKVVGLLFVYNVRLIYDREVARRSELT